VVDTLWTFAKETFADLGKNAKTVGNYNKKKLINLLFFTLKRFDGFPIINSRAILL